MTPGEVAFRAYAAARKQRGEAPAVMLWEGLTPTRRQVFDEVALAVRGHCRQELNSEGASNDS